MNDYLYFESIREHRGCYFVEYQPPVAEHPFATLSLVFPNATAWERVQEYLDHEVRYWLGRYPVPLMVWAYDDKDDIIKAPDQSGDCLVVWIDPKSGERRRSWDINDLGGFLNTVPPHPNWRTVYTDVPFRTDSEVKGEARKKALEQSKHNRVLKIVLMLWLSAIPAGYAIFEFLGPAWLGLVGLGIVLWNALRTALKIWGHVQPSAREKEETEKQRRKEHYFYHCERNPDGFIRLRSENFEQDARVRVRKEAEELARKTDTCSAG